MHTDRISSFLLNVDNDESRDFMAAVNGQRCVSSPPPLKQRQTFMPPRIQVFWCDVGVLYLEFANSCLPNVSCNRRTSMGFVLLIQMEGGKETTSVISVQYLHILREGYTVMF